MNGYIRKIVAVILSLVFCVAVIVGVGVIFSVRNVNIEYIYYSEDGQASSSRTYADYVTSADNLNALKGQSLVLLSMADVESCVSGRFISVQSCNKVFPSTLDIVLKERVEQFCRPNSSGGFDVYDSEGVYMLSRQENLNPADDSPDVLVYAQDESFSYVVQICGYFNQSFGSLRNLVRSASVSHDAILGSDNITLSLYSGLSIVIYDYDEYAEQKISAVYEIYDGLSESQKLRGSIYAVSRSGSSYAPYAAYYNSELGY